mgnify:CR=1 FL=1
MKTFILGLLMLGASATALADDHGGGGDVVAMQAYYCTLNDGKDMADVDKALGPWRKWKEQTNYNGWTAELTPQFDIRNDYDFYWLNFLPFGDMAAVLDSWATEGAAAQRAIDSVSTCKAALYGSRLKFPMVDESDLQQTSVVNIDSCTRKDGVDMDTLMARHAEFVASSEAAEANYIWNVVWPMAGVPSIMPNGAERIDFANMFWFPNLASQMAALDSEANGEFRMLRKTYLQSFADCDDRNTFAVKILNVPNRPWN